MTRIEEICKIDQQKKNKKKDLLLASIVFILAIVGPGIGEYIAEWLLK